MNIKETTSEILREYRLNRKGTPAAFIKMYRKFSTVPGLSKTKALELAQTTFPSEYRAYVEAQNRGEVLPPLDQKPDYQQRRASMAANGGRLN